MINSLPKSLIEAARTLLENDQFPKDAVIGRLKGALDSGRYEVQHHSENHQYHEFQLLPKKPHNAKMFYPRQGRPEQGWHDPEISDLHTPNPEDAFPRTHAKLKPDSGYVPVPEAPHDPNVIYRGMSQEEFENVKKTGKIQSHGHYNLEGQEGLTYYSKSLSQAHSYAHGFAPAAFKATGQHKAYIVAIKNPGTDVKIKGTGEDEVGIPHAVPTSDILHVYEGRAYSAQPGNYSVHKGWDGLEEGSSNEPLISVGWKKIPFEHKEQ